MSKKPIRPVPLGQLEREFEVHLRFLDKSISDYDRGDVEEFRRLATSLRVLLHRTKHSVPLVDHIGLPDDDYVSYAAPINERNLLTECSIVMVSISNLETKYLPVLDQGPVRPRLMTLDAWKNEPVLRDDRREIMTRWDLVLTVANQQGAHVDANLAEQYYRLVHENSCGWLVSDGRAEVPLAGQAETCIRHIAWEGLVSLRRKWLRVLGNRGCPCGSGRKARYCCSRTAA